ncbi:MAG: hypothetical protein KJ017_11355 [Alphaproteobacteria bacterium]|nr:hypothetical protein [Alphaproteobacteria bacterium]
MRFANVPDFEDFDPAVLTRSGNSHFIIVGNFFFQDDPLSIDGRRRRFNFKSGISETAFHALMREFCDRRNRQIMLAGEDVSIITGDLNDFRTLQLENGARFSYDFVDAKKVEEYVTYTRSAGGIPQSQFREVRLDA